MFPQSKKIIVGSRGSRLALIQVKEVFNLLEGQGQSLAYDVVTLQTQGDKDQQTPLSSNPGEDFFTDALDQALSNEQVDVTVHSAKDLAQQLPEGLEIFALTKAFDETDCLVGRAKLVDLPAGAKIGTSSTLRHQEIKKVRADVELIPIRGPIEDRLRQLKSGKLNAIVVATCALKRLGLESEIVEVLPYEATALQGQLAIVGRREDVDLKNLFSLIDARKDYGRVMLVGAGPGDPELITLKAIKALENADCVFYDFLASSQLLQYAHQAQLIYVGKRKGNHSLPQGEVCRMLREQARSGKNVVRLKGGDPMVFGRGAEEMLYLQNYHIEVEVIPGVSSATGLPSHLGIPLTARGISSSVAFVSGHGPAEMSDDPQPIAIPEADTLVFFMGLTKLSDIVEALLLKGWKPSTPVIVIESGTTAQEKIVDGTLQDIQKRVGEQGLKPPALIMVGETVRFYRGRQQKKNHILYLGTNPQKYQALGQLVHHPMIELIENPLTPQQIDQLREDLQKCDLVLLTSRFAVRFFMSLLKKHNLTDLLSMKKIAVIGRDTEQALEQFGYEAKVVADEESSEGFLRELQENFDLRGSRILFPRSALPNPFLIKELRSRGSEVYEYPVYQNKKPERKELPKGKFDQIIFTSPSTVVNYLRDHGPIPKDWEIVCKGPLTQKCLHDAGYQSRVMVASLTSQVSSDLSHES